MLINELRNLCIPTEEHDGFDKAFYDGIIHVLDSCGDGGLSQQYINGLSFAIKNLDPKEYE